VKPLHDLAAERRVLISLVRMAHADDLGAPDRLTPAEMYHPDHAALLTALYAVHDSGGIPDPFTMRAALSAAAGPRSVLELLEALEFADVRIGQTREAQGRKAQGQEKR